MSRYVLQQQQRLDIRHQEDVEEERLDIRRKKDRKGLVVWELVWGEWYLVPSFSGLKNVTMLYS